MPEDIVDFVQIYSGEKDKVLNSNDKKRKKTKTRKNTTEESNRKEKINARHLGAMLTQRLPDKITIQNELSIIRAQ